MDALPSTEFRRIYAKLTDPVLVTVNGHVIGKWTPNPDNGINLRGFEDGPQLTPTPEFLATGRYSSRPFTPVPKVKK